MLVGEVTKSEIHDLDALMKKVMSFITASRGSEEFTLSDYGITGRKDLIALIQRVSACFSGKVGLLISQTNRFGR